MKTNSMLAGSVVALALAGGCASYVPHPDEDAARLRISQLSFMMLVPFLQRVEPDGRCGERFSTNSLYPAPVTSGNVLATTAGPQKAPTQPRERMFESPPPEQTHTTELRLRPGRYILNASGTPQSGKMCNFAMNLQMEPREQYWLQASSDGKLCRATLRRVATESAASRWVPEKLEKPTSGCTR
ncbi:MAG: hypothetical protein R3E68_15835 [Burkholderiaceae bacterium]